MTIQLIQQFFLHMSDKKHLIKRQSEKNICSRLNVFEDICRKSPV